MYLSKNFGVSFSTTRSHISFVDFFASLVGQKLEFPLRSGNKRQVLLDQDGRYFYGVVITIKNQKRFASLVSNGKDFEVKITNLKDLEKIAEFNFFIIDKLNGLGLYQWHHGACTATNFASMMVSTYRIQLEAQKAAELKALPSDAPAKQEKAIRSKFFHGLDFQLLVQSRDIEKVLEAYKKITSFKYEIASLETQVTDAVPLQGLVSKSTHHVRFDISAAASRIIAGIKGMIPHVNAKTARIEVLDDEDEPISVKITDVPVNFGELQYDDFISGLQTFKLNDVKSCTLFTGLKHKCEKEYPHVFSKKIAV